MYDTHLGQFLNADPIILDEQNSQNFALYSYVLNNPLKYTDPSGYTQQGGPASAAKAGQTGKMLQMQLLETNNNINAIKEGAEPPFFLANGLVFLPAVGGSVFTYGMPNIRYNGYLREVFLYGARSGSNSNGFQFKSVSNANYQLDFGGSGDRGMTFPSFSTLWSNYPPDVNGSHAHPSVDPYPNQCAIRVSDAFMKSGIDMGSYPKVNKTTDGYARSSKGLADWTWQNFGKPKIMSQDVFERDYKNSTGLLYIAPPLGGVGHIDLYNAGTTGSGYYLGSEIWFWPIK